MRNLAIAVAAAAVLAAPASVPAEPRAKPAKPAETCFFSTNWQGWRATPDSRAMYLRIAPRSLYRIDFVGQCYDLNRAGARLITSSRSATICSALDLDIRVSNGSGYSTPCLVDKLTRLSPAEAAALPKALTP